MNLLLDTHILILWLENPDKLSNNIVRVIENNRNTVFISTGAIWEMEIKKQIGKLETPDNLLELLEKNNFLPLSITIDHVLTLNKLPEIHNDPFDRIQIAQAMYDQLIFITMDKTIWKYKINILEP